MIQLKRAYEPAEAARGRVTLVYSAHDETHNNAVVLARELERRRARSRAMDHRKPLSCTARSSNEIRAHPVIHHAALSMNPRYP